jgi:hypothetical protein
VFNETPCTEFIEMLFMGVQMQFPMVLKLVEHPNVWVGDTGTSCNSTPHKEGIEGMHQLTNGIGIENGNGSLSKVTASGEIPGMVCDKTGNEVTPVKLEDVRLTPGNKFNLLSISKLLKEG